MLPNKVRHIRHLLNFDYSQNREYNKKKSDHILDTLNIDKNEFFLTDFKKDFILIENISHEDDTFKSIKVFKSNRFVTISLMCYFLKEGLDSDFGQLLLDGRKQFCNYNDFSINRQTLNTYKTRDVVNIKFKQNLLNPPTLLTRDSLLEKISKYNVEDERIDEIIEKELFLSHYFKGETLCYKKEIWTRMIPEIDALFCEEV